MKKDCLKDFWFKYDAFLVVIMIAETVATWTNVIMVLEMTPGVGEVIRPALNGYRLARMVRVLRASPSIVSIAIGIVAALKSVLSTFYIIAFELFCTAVVFRSRFGGLAAENVPERESPLEWYIRQGSDPDYGPQIYEFRTVNDAVFTCLFAGVFTDNITSVVGHISRISSSFMILFLSHVVITNLILLNILVGVVCECISEVSDQTREDMKTSKVREVLLEQLTKVDDDGNFLIAPAEFLEFMMNTEVTDVLEDECGIDKMALAIIGENMFYDLSNPGVYKEQSFGAVLFKIINSNANKNSTATDILNLQRELKEIQKEADTFRDEVHEMLDKILEMASQVQTGVHRVDPKGGGVSKTSPPRPG